MTYLGNPPVNGVFKKLDNISGSFNGTTTTFNLTSGGAATTPGLAQNLIISLGGIIQEPGSAFTISGSTITFTAAPASYVSFWGIQLGDVGLATNPNQSAMTTQTFTATAGQVTFTVAGGYTAGQLQVFQNGVQLVVGTDVTASNGTTFVLTNAANSGDTLVAISYSSFIVGNAVAKSGDTMSGDLTVPNFTYTGTLTGSTGVVNIGSGQVYKDASGNVGVGTTSPNTKTQIYKAAYSSFTGTSLGALAITDSTASVNYYSSIDFNTSANNSLPLARIGMQYTGSGSYLVFGTSNSYGSGITNTAMAIDYSGNLLVGTTSVDPSGSNVTGAAIGGIGYISTCASSNPGAVFARKTTTGDIVIFRYGTTQVGTINTNGTGTTYNSASDYRLKHDVQALSNGLATVSALKPVTYKWNVNNSYGEGFIAHELQEVIPEAVTNTKDQVDADGNPVYQGVDYSKIVVHLVAAIQELKADLDAAKAEIEVLKGK
jgi:hypothetical protein